MRALPGAPAALAVAFALVALAPDIATTSLTEVIIAGSRQPCPNEGERVNVDSIKDMRCFKCICKNGFVECAHEQCPDIRNCYMQMPREGCCVKCKGCLYNGVMHVSHTEWTDPEDSCRILRCEAGVITKSAIHCYTPCGSPRPPPPGHCCPSCQGCHINGQKVSEGRDATIEEDPCVTCHCSKNKLTCVKRACPVLPCPTTLQITPKGKCCPICGEGKQPKFLLPDHAPNKPCILGKDYYPHGNMFNIDKCTKCSCVNGTSICSRTSCPVLECAKEHQKTPPGECCPRCPPVEEVRSTCTVNGETYEDGVSWRLDDCKSCMCHGGEPRCAMEQCPPVVCSLGYKKERPPGQCCFRCVEEEGVCTVYGDPHYKTFDGKFYTFQGSCKYQLASDCINRTFSIRVTNDGRNAKYSSRTKTVSLKIGDSKLNLGHKLRVKIDGKRVTLPHESAIGTVIKDKNDNILVTTTLGIKLYWNGAGYLEVMAPISFKNRLCGLCGNFNSIVRDDFKMRNNTFIKGADRKSAKLFGDSWRVGGKRACSRKQDGIHRETTYGNNIRKMAGRTCKMLNKSEAFAICRHKINPHNYYESCVMDMCECPERDCFCDSFNAYARECHRLGATLGDWKKATGCGSERVKGVVWQLPPSRKRNSTSPLLTSFLPMIPSRPRQPPPIIH